VNRRETYARTRFSAETLLEVKAALAACFEGETHMTGTWDTVTAGVTWTFESEGEFWSEYRRDDWSSFGLAWAHVKPVPDAFKTVERLIECHVDGYSDGTVSVRIEGWNKEDIHAVQAVFERHRLSSRLPEPLREEPPAEPVTVFIGHGRDPAWRDLKDHLQDLHDYRVVAYEVGARAGHEVRDVLQEMMADASFACLVLTGEDKLQGDKIQARQNVVHELGLFQGRLGFHRAIALVQEGIELPSNIAGVTQLRFAEGQIKSNFGDVLATLRREFGTSR
jgi:predicted nucleotide-binding protein